jgi:hypothetical protein
MEQWSFFCRSTVRWICPVADSTRGLHRQITSGGGITSCKTLDYRLADQGFESRRGLVIFLFTASRLALWPTQPPIQWVRGAFSWGLSDRSVKLTTHLHLVPRSKNEWSYTSSSPIYLQGVVLSKEKNTGKTSLLPLPYLTHRDDWSISGFCTDSYEPSASWDFIHSLLFCLACKCMQRQLSRFTWA